MNPTRKSVVIIVCMAFLAAVSLAAGADDAKRDRERGDRPAVFDRRYDHNRYYPPRGQVVREAPPRGHVVPWRGVPYHFHEGIWYRPSRSQWIVVSPPIGLIVPFLPPFYTTIWIAGAPYYYANDVYYTWRPAQRGYVVVEPPAERTPVSTQTTTDELYVYPKSGQTPEQQATDRYQCHRWAVNETGFDPTLPLGGVDSTQSAEKRTSYFRAMTACLEGRGYSVK